MKYLKIALSVLTIACIGTLFAFSTAKKQSSSTKESKVFTARCYEFIPQAGVPNPPTTKAQVTNTANWKLRDGSPGNTCPTCNSGTLWCKIQFDDANTTLAQALDILGERVRLGQSITTGSTYTVGSQSVTIFFKAA